MNLTTYTLDKIPSLRILGRTTQNLTPLTLFWTASGLEFNIQAREVWIHVHAEYKTFEPWIDILIDGALTQRLMITAGDHDICVLRTSDSAPVRNIRILRDTQAMPGDPDMLLQLSSITTDGLFSPVSEPAIRLEFIGDSITTGEGLCGAPGEMDWVPSSFNCISSYAHRTAEAMDAAYHVISQCGWGVYCSYEGKTKDTIPPYYEQICGVTNGGRSEEYGASLPWNFNDFRPDAIIINLGTNDAGALTNPDVPVNNPALIEESAYQFLRQLRRCNSDAYLIWCLGMLGDTLCDEMQQAVDRFKNDSRDERCCFLRLPDTASDEFGSRNHPGSPAHKHAAEVLTEYLKSIF